MRRIRVLFLGFFGGGAFTKSLVPTTQPRRSRATGLGLYFSDDLIMCKT